MPLVFDVIPRQNILHTKLFLSVRLDLYLHKPLLFGISHLVFTSFPNHGHEKLWLHGTKIEPVMKIRHGFFPGKIRVAVDEYQQDVPDEDDDVCPVECVREFKTDEEFCKILEKFKGTDTLIVVDFFRTSCGSCRYIAQGFAKLCKKSGSHDAPVIFLKHNVIDEYDEESEVADRLRIRAVPLFHFYKDGKLLEAFPTRDKERIIAAILKYSSLEAEDILS
ncbi:unnamed protein product [Lathyrus sativus]|nr:unnamed protein product [Lathyrus sativus]